MFEDNRRSLIELLKENKNTAAFVGAGASSLTGIGDWTMLLEQFRKEFKVEIDVKEQIKILGHAGTASLIFSHIKDLSLYTRFMKTHSLQKDTNWHELQFVIIDKFKIILTTNYDDSFESCYEAKKGSAADFKIQILPNFHPMQIFNERAVVYLHGSRKGNEFIFREEEYDTHYPSFEKKEFTNNSKLEMFLEAAITSLNLVFIGFSFNDKHFKDFYQNCINRQRNKLIVNDRTCYPQQKHFIIISEDAIRTTFDFKEAHKFDFNPVVLVNNNILEYTSDGYKCTFHKDAHANIQSLKVSQLKKKFLLEEFKSTERNKDLVQFFNQLNIKIVTYPKSKYVEISNILNDIKPISSEEDLSTARYA